MVVTINSPILLDELDGTGNAYRMVRDEVAPDPVVMPDDARSIEMRPIAQCVSVADRSHVVTVRDRRPHGRVDAKISGPSGNEHTIRGHSRQH